MECHKGFERCSGSCFCEMSSFHQDLMHNTSPGYAKTDQTVRNNPIEWQKQDSLHLDGFCVFFYVAFMT